jgi:hypothetical protein
LQAQQAALDKSNAAANTYSGGVNANGQTLPGYVPIPSPTSLGGAITTLGNTSSQPTSNFSQAQNTAGAAASDLLNSAPQQNAAVIAQQQAIQGLTNQYNGENMAISGGATNLAEAGGEQGLLQNLYSSNLGAMQTGLTNILQGNAQQQAAYTGAGNVANATASGATTQQGTQQSGQGAVVNALAPQTQYGALTNPATGQPISSSALVSGASSLPAAAQSALSALPQSAQSAIMLEAQKLQNNQETFAQAQANLSAYGQTGTTALNAILGPGFNANTNAGVSSGQQQVAGTGGAITSQQQTQVAGYKSAQQQAQNLGLQLNQLISHTGINPSDVNAVNAGIQKIASNTSDPNYGTFQNLLNDLANTYSQVLTPAGGSVTNLTTQIAQSLLNSSMSGTGISQVLQNLDAQVTAKISGVMTNNSNGSTNTNTTGGANPWS